MAFYCRKPPARGETKGVLTTLKQHCGLPNSAGNKMCGGWKYFLANCPRNNQLCSGMSGGWVAAITVCGQRLF